jgi:hypothetical protein
MLKVIERLSKNPTVVAAIVAGIATLGASRITSQSAEERLEGNLIVDAVRVCDGRQATNNLNFLMRAGFLPNHSSELKGAIDNGLEKFIPPDNCRPRP